MQLLINFSGKSQVYDVDEALTIPQLKNLIEDNEYIPSNSQYLVCNDKILVNGTLEDNQLEDTNNIYVNLRILGGACRYKKATSRLRWKTKLKRMRRLKRIRRKNRLRSR
jgi:hypothetical protein|tara:strand:+ start:12650 stop:12979 length:330 start_codon:yes stop_codon:yes gene_type:complete